MCLSRMRWQSLNMFKMCWNGSHFTHSVKISQRTRITFRALCEAFILIKPKDTLVINKRCRSEIFPEILVEVSHQLTEQLMHVAEQILEAWCRGITARKHADASTEECNEWVEGKRREKYVPWRVRTTNMIIQIELMVTVTFLHTWNHVTSSFFLDIFSYQINF
jgi:hypothetical protein